MEPSMGELHPADPAIKRESSPSSDLPHQISPSELSQFNDNPNLAESSNSMMLDNLGLTDELETPGGNDYRAITEQSDETADLSESDKHFSLFDRDSSTATQQTSEFETTEIQSKQLAPEVQISNDATDVEMSDLSTLDAVLVSSEITAQPNSGTEQCPDEAKQMLSNLPVQNSEMELVANLDQTRSVNNENSILVSDAPHQAGSEAKTAVSDEGDLRKALTGYFKTPDDMSIKSEPMSPSLRTITAYYPEMRHKTSDDQTIIDLIRDDSEDEDSDTLFLPKSSHSQSDLENDEFTSSKSRKKGTKSKTNATTERNHDKTKDRSRCLKPKTYGGVKKSSPKSAKRKSRPAKNSGVTGIGDHDEIANYDPIIAHHAEGEWEAAPEIEASTTKQQLEDMIKNCPLGSNDLRNRRDKNAINKAAKSFGRKKVTVENGKWRLAGMKTPLYHHQILGAAWMYKRELNLEGEPFGGILADSMGLGKTLETIALIIANPPGDDVQEDCRSTLIIVPATVIDQWDDELAQHGGRATKCVLRYKASEKLNLQRVTNSDVVLASYWELMNSCPWPDKDSLLQLRPLRRGKGDLAANDDPAPIENDVARRLSNKEGGQLHDITWYRVVLDEAHSIKNQMTRVSFAANALKSKYRWALSGTPIMNRPEEYYSTLRFLKALQTTKTYKEFKARFCNSENDICNQRLREFNEKLMFRRTTESSLLGRPLIKLPTPHEHLTPINFTRQEYILYNAVEQRFLRMKDEKFSEKDPRKSFKHELHQLTRLRQLTFDPLIIPREMKILFTGDELDAVYAEMKEASDGINQLHLEIAQWIVEKKIESQGPENLVPEEMEFCACCSLEVEDPVFISIKKCGHIFSRSCILRHAVQQKVSDDFMENTCPKCTIAFSIEHNLRPVKTGKPVNHQQRKKQEKPKYPPKGLDITGYRPKPGPEQLSALAWLEKHDARDVMIRSSKLKSLRSELFNNDRGTATDKKIIFVQWVQSAILIGSMLSEEGVPFVYYWGGMSKGNRVGAVSKIKSEQDCKVMICGLKVGCVGLNWTWANHVIITDPWWNKCVETQAFCRTHRLGQEKQTHLMKLSVKGSVDQRLLDMQKKKTTMIARTNANELTSEEMEELLGGNEHFSS